MLGYGVHAVCIEMRGKARTDVQPPPPPPPPNAGTGPLAHNRFLLGVGYQLAAPAAPLELWR